MKKRTRPTFSHEFRHEFRRETMQLVVENDHTISEAAEPTCIGLPTINGLAKNLRSASDGHHENFPVKPYKQRIRYFERKI